MKKNDSAIKETTAESGKRLQKQFLSKIKESFQVPHMRSFQNIFKEMLYQNDLITVLAAFFINFLV